MSEATGPGTRDTPSQGRKLADHAEELTSRFVGGVNRLAARAQEGARRVKDRAQEMRTSPVVQHATAARERGNLEAAFWLLNEEFTRRPGDTRVALDYWDVALSLGRVDIARAAGVALVEGHAADGEPELAAQHWLELVKDAPDTLVSPAAIATILPALKARLAAAPDEGADDRDSLATCLRRAVRCAVDPRNTGLHPGVALRIFEEGRTVNPEAARRAAEAALESPNLHETKRQRLTEWLAGGAPAERRAPTRKPPEPSAAAGARGEAEAGAEVERPVERAAPTRAAAPAAKPAPRTPRTARAAATDAAAPARLATPEPATPTATAPAEPAVATRTAARPAAPAPSEPPDAGPRFARGRLTGLDGDGLLVRGAPDGRLSYAEIEAVSVAEILGLEDGAVRVVDLIRNWSRRKHEPLDVVRLRVEELDLAKLVTRTHALGSDFAALMGEIMERTSAIPLPDPESALGTRISSFDSPELYARFGLRL